MGGSTLSSLSHLRIGLVTETFAQEASLFYPVSRVSFELP